MTKNHYEMHNIYKKLVFIVDKSYTGYNNIVELPGGYPDMTGSCPDYLYYQEKERAKQR